MTTAAKARFQLLTLLSGSYLFFIPQSSSIGKTSFHRSELENYQPQPRRQGLVVIAILYSVQNLPSEVFWLIAHHSSVSACMYT